jgi:uncharacterized membrane protein
MPVGLIALIIVAILVYFGLLHRALDRMRLSDKGALAVILAIVVGSIANIRLAGPPNEFLVNVGGALVPIGIVVYLLVTADETRERQRGVFAALVSGIAIYAVSRLLPAGPEQPGTILDPAFVFALIAGTVGYLTGRSRRSAFIGGTMGIILGDVLHFIESRGAGAPSRTWVGGAGGFDTVILAGVIAVGLAEIVGEILERVHRESKAGGTEVASLLVDEAGAEGQASEGGGEESEQ